MRFGYRKNQEVERFMANPIGHLKTINKHLSLIHIFTAPSLNFITAVASIGRHSFNISRVLLKIIVKISVSYYIRYSKHLRLSDSLHFCGESLFSCLTHRLSEPEAYVKSPVYLVHFIRRQVSHTPVSYTHLLI